MLCAVNALAQEASGMPSLWELTKSGGPLMWPIGATSVVALAYAFERWLALSRAKLGHDRFGRDVVETAKNSGPSNALEVCKREATPLSRILAVALTYASAAPDEREKRVEEVAGDEVRKLGANLRPLLVVYIVAPLLGLLGTVWGLIEAFATIAMKQGLGKPELLASGVYQALVTTAAGLTVAIPTVILYYYLKGRVEGFARRTESLYIELDTSLRAPAVAHANP
jgi:biopolymer transport protein ExbB